MKYFSLVFIVWFKLYTVLWLKIGSVEGILGGKLAVHDQFKYMVSVQADGKHICGGAIIDEEHIITAAHCFLSDDNNFINKKFTVVGGIVDLMHDTVPPIEEAVSTIYLPREFKRIKRNAEIAFYPEIGDISVLVLKEKLPLGERLQALSLPQRDDYYNQSKYVNAIAILTGYGSNINPRQGIKRPRDSAGTTNRQGVHLRLAEMIIQHKNTCKTKFPFPIHDKYLIAKINKRGFRAQEGACDGDGGSPLVYKGMLIGVLAQHWSDCNEIRIGSIYTRVSEYSGYIKNVMDKQQKKNDSMVKYNEVTTSTGRITWEIERICNFLKIKSNCDK